MAERIDNILAQNWQVKLGELGAVYVDYDDIDQCIQTIVRTPIGSVPHNPAFGSRCFEMIDAPIDVAGPQMVVAAVDAIAAWERRAKVERITPRVQEAGVVLLISWRPTGEVDAALRRTEVRL